MTSVRKGCCVAIVVLVSTLLIVIYISLYTSSTRGPWYIILHHLGNAITPTSPCVPKVERDKHEGRFYKFSTSGFRFYAYSAFYDDRASLQSDPVIRIIGISDDLDEFKATGLIPNFEITCVLIHLHGTTRVKIEEKPFSCESRYSFGGYDANFYVYTCPTNGIAPNFLKIETTLDSSNVTSCMPIEYPPKRRKRKRFGVCVPVSYGNLDPYHLIEWLETQRMLGVGLISVYDLYLGSEARRVLQHYADIDGLVQIRKMDRIFSFEHNLHLLELGASLNDCLYRNMYRVERIVVSDFDEFIKPMRYQNLAQLVGFLEDTITANQSLNYAFRNIYYFLELQPDDSISKYFKIFRYRKKVEVSPLLHRIKPIILTMSCTHMFSHLCLGLTANYSNRELYQSIEPEIAVNQHYRKCPLSSEECDDAMMNATQDDSMLVYYDVLRTRVRKKIEAIMKSVPPDL